MAIKKYFKSMDGNEAAATGAYLFTEVTAIFPITPSSPMAEYADAWSARDGKENLFGSKVKVVEMQSEAGAAGAVHGAAQAGSLATTFTASQGLLLMIPNIYKVVGELLPTVFHVSARSLATRALSIFGDHQDIYAVRQTGITMIASHSVQEASDLAPLAHLVAIKSKAPVLHFFDGFRTSHEIQKVEVIEGSEWKKLLDLGAVKAFKDEALNPHNFPVTRGGAENDDIYFQAREAQNSHFANVLPIAEEYFKKVSRLTGRKYAPFVYVGPKDADRVIIAMGSVTETITEVINDLNAKGEKVGLVKVHLYRPFSATHLLNAIPRSVKKVAVLDRTKETGALGEPLYLDVVASVAQSNRRFKVLVGGRYGLSSKDTQPNQIKAVYDFLNSEKVFTGFTIGINDDLTHLSLPIDSEYHIHNDYTSCLFYGLGSDGTVSANKSSIKIIGDHTNLYSQAYFAYDSKKAGGTTRSNLRFGPTPIHSTYYVTNADFISCSQDSYILKFDMLKNLKKGGTFLLNTSFSKKEILAFLPNKVKRQLARRHAKFYIIDATEIAKSIGMGRHTNTILQSAFFKLNPAILPFDEALDYMKKAAYKTYSKKGDDVVKLNYTALDKGAEALIEVEVDPNWLNLEVHKENARVDDEYFDYYCSSIAALDGNEIPVSEFAKGGLLTGSMQNNLSLKEKRNTASEVPEWTKANCIQCGKCAFVCPHSTIRTFVLTAEELAVAPKSVQDNVIPVLGKKDLYWTVQVSPDNCVGCGLCANECPVHPVAGVPSRALAMVDVKSQAPRVLDFDYVVAHVTYKADLFPITMVKGASLLKPYFEVSGACAGCGETPYYRLVAQLFGKDMLVANATGCSSIYSGSTPSNPFAIDADGQGPAWANSLFEDNAEYGFGMRTATDYKLQEIRNIIEGSLKTVEPELRTLLKTYLENQKDRKVTRPLKDEIIRLVEVSKSSKIKALLDYKADLINKSVWIVGGDGWAYDIGYGGLDHVIAQRENVNILVLDTEVYSNTGGQASKSTQTGAIAKFAAAGKVTPKKDLGAIARSYKNVYVAQVSMGANPVQLIKALQEAESYDGPSVIIAYSPCMEHGIKGGLGNHQTTQRKAVEAGYFTPYRFDPRLEKPLTIDAKEPDFTKFRDFLLGETRFAQLPKVNPLHAQELFIECEEKAKGRYQTLLSEVARQG
ncbi:MAG: pyruvate:ferredoxin (flavodoxin) oxidoreductase [Bacillales bacterium]|jgi:pyruvate-ferredoxin/flavodoxin oxidoreductase|nr:pyruvate:ferredoxin (flavodoxin) oxidoreductase [Bacillales bacterium]